MNDLILNAQDDTEALIIRELDRDPSLVSSHTKRGYRADLVKFEDWRKKRPFTKLTVEAYMTTMRGEGKRPGTINRALASIRWYARRLGDLVLEMPGIDLEVRKEISFQAGRVASVRDVKSEGGEVLAGRHIDIGELTAIMGACFDDVSICGMRDAAMIAFAWKTGARRAEIAGLSLSDIVGEDELEGLFEVVIRGKGGKVRGAYIGNGAYLSLRDWLKVRGNKPGPVFCPIGKGGRMSPGRKMTGEALRLVLNKRLEQAGISKVTTWHDFRRTFSGNLLDLGIDLVTVQKLMGHSSPTTTSRYDRRGDEVKRKAVQGLFVPYRERLIV